MADPQRVARARAVATQRLAGRHLAEHGQAKIERPGGGVATHQFDAVAIGQVEQALGQTREKHLIDPGQGQRQRESHRPRAAGRQVAQIDRQGLVAQAFGPNRRQKMPTLDQHVAGDRPLHAGRGLQQRAVIADAQHHLRRRTGRAGEVLADQVELAQGHGGDCRRVSPAPFRLRAHAAGWPTRPRSARPSSRTSGRGALPPCGR